MCACVMYLMERIGIGDTHTNKFNLVQSESHEAASMTDIRRKGGGERKRERERMIHTEHMLTHRQ